MELSWGEGRINSLVLSKFILRCLYTMHGGQLSGNETCRSNSVRAIGTGNTSLETLSCWV